MSNKYVDEIIFIMDKNYKFVAPVSKEQVKNEIKQQILQAQLDAVNDLWRRVNLNKPADIQIQAMGMKHLKMIFDNKKAELGGER